MKKYKRGEVVKVLIDKMLEPFNSSFDEVQANPEIEGKPWFQYYTFKTLEDFEKFKEFFILTFTKNTRPAFTKSQAEKEFSWFNLMYGLKEEYRHNGKELQEESSK
jgi:hypothetical protein